MITSDESLAGVRILILTAFETDEMVAAALRAGASGFLGKGTEPEALLDAIRTVGAGESLLSPAATTALIQRFCLSPSRAGAHLLASWRAWTRRGREITTLVGQGMSNDEIAGAATAPSL